MNYFIHHLTISHRPVFEENGSLRDDIKQVITDIEATGADPIEELRRCRRFLDGQIGYMKRNPKMFEKWQFQTKDPFKADTLGALEYMQKNIAAIITHLAWKQWGWD